MDEIFFEKQDTDPMFNIGTSIMRSDQKVLRYEIISEDPKLHGWVELPATDPLYAFFGSTYKKH